LWHGIAAEGLTIGQEANGWAASGAGPFGRVEMNRSPGVWRDTPNRPLGGRWKIASHGRISPGPERTTIVCRPDDPPSRSTGIEIRNRTTQHAKSRSSNTFPSAAEGFRRRSRTN